MGVSGCQRGPDWVVEKTFVVEILQWVVHFE
jgi:hypothetical protein